MRIYIAICILICLLNSCSNEDASGVQDPTKKEWQKEAVSFLSNEKELLSFGAFDCAALLKKAIYDSDIADSGLIPLEMLEDYSEVLQTEFPMYYAIWPYQDATVMPDIAVVGKVKDADGFVSTLKKDFSISKIHADEAVQYIFTKEFLLGLTSNEMVFFKSEKQDTVHAKKVINRILKGLKSNQTDSLISDIIGEATDMSMAINSEALQRSLSADLGIDSPVVKSKLKTLMTMHVSFDKGSIELKNKNYPPKEIQDWNLLEKDSKKLVEKLGKGTPAAALTVNINVDAYEGIQEKYFPESLANSIQDSQLAPSIKDLVPSELAVIEALVKKEGIKSFIDGKFALGIYSSDRVHTEYSAYMGIGPGLKGIIDSEIAGLDGFVYSMKIKDREFSMYSSKEYGPQDSGHKIKLTEEFENLGKAPISGFVDLDKLPLDDMLPRTAKPIIDMLRSIVFNASITEGTILINMKDGKKNSLTQLCNKLPDILLGSLFL